MYRSKFLEHAFVNSHALLTTTLDCKPIRIQPDGELIFNPSILNHNGDILLTARSSNANTVREITFPESFDFNNLYNFNYLVQYSNNGRINSKTRIDDNLLRKIIGDKFRGIEDIRLFNHNNRIGCLANAVSVDKNSEHKFYSTQQVTFYLENNVIVDPLIWNSPAGKSIEKNWVPLVKDNHLYLVYNLNPLTVYKTCGTSTSLTKGSISNDPISLSGGTPFVEMNGNYLCVAHYPRITLDKMYYRHCFIVMNDNFEIIEVSEPFFIQRRGIEFACGLTKYKDSLLLSYGVADRAAFFVKISISKIRNLVISI